MISIRWCAPLLLCAATLAHAQYKYVGPDGTVTYSDQPPPPSVKDVEVRNFSTGAPVSALPFELRQAASRFPVQIFTTGQCLPCEQARKYMHDRGIPYTEKTVTTQEDIDAMKKVAKENILPMLFVGRQKFAGFTEASWSAMLDDAGYPSKSVMPPTYQNPAPEPLVPQGAPPPAAATNNPAASAQAGPSPSAGTTPSGFKF